jgi:hypothetical protein
MPSIIRLVGFTALWSPATIVSSLKHAERKTFSLEETEVQRRTPWSALHVMRNDYARHGLMIPSQLEAEINRLAPPGKTSVVATPIPGDREYNVVVQVGNRNFTLDIDTGSSDLWVFPSRILLSDSVTEFIAQFLLFSQILKKARAFIVARLRSPFRKSR